MHGNEKTEDPKPPSISPRVPPEQDRTVSNERDRPSRPGTSSARGVASPAIAAALLFASRNAGSLSGAAADAIASRDLGRHSATSRKIDLSLKLFRHS